MEQQDYQLKYIEEKLDGHEERIKGLEKMSEEFTKISVILEMQTEMNKEQNITMNKINDNLTSLNHTTHRLGERVGELEVQVKDVKENDTISITKLMKKIGWTVLSLGIGGLLTWLGAKLKSHH